MKKQGQFLPIIAPILVLVPLASIMYLFPMSLVASELSIQSEDENQIYLPLVGKNTWPSICYAPSTENYQAPTPEIPEIILQQGTTITVTTNADIINGNVSSVAGLLANPGPDGVALREAIEATNNDPDEYTIRFSAQLDGTTIYTGSGTNQDLPPLLGGSVIINGDIDGDLAPDITISNGSTFQYPFGFKIQSSNNTLHALQMEGYFIGVLIKPTTATTANTTFRSITVSNLVMSNVLAGINLRTGPDQGAMAANNRWEEILLINNVLSVKQNGVTITLNNTIGDHLANVTVANNRILVTQNIDSASFGIQLMAGFWVGSNGNVMTNITITQNTIQGNPDQAIALISGAVAASGNMIDGVSILENEILISNTNWSYQAGTYGINLYSGDGGSDYIDPSYEPITYPEYNVLRNIDVIGNAIEGFDGRGISIAGGCCGARNNTIENVNILSNQIRSQIPDVEFNVTGIHVQSGDAWADRHTADNLVSNIIVQSNTVYLGRQVGLPPIDLYPSGAISIIGGGGAPGADRNEVREIWLSMNEVDSVVPAFHLIGAREESNENVINTAHIYCNTIPNAPIYPIWNPPLKGIVLTGAIRDSTLNRVENITLFYNNVASIWNDLTVIPNVESTATNNVVDYRIYP